MDKEKSPKLFKVELYVCENCLNGVPGECHMPECIFIRKKVGTLLLDSCFYKDVPLVEIEEIED